jgi:hypothetical protein
MGAGGREGWEQVAVGRGGYGVAASGWVPVERCG